MPECIPRLFDKLNIFESTYAIYNGKLYVVSPGLSLASSKNHLFWNKKWLQLIESESLAAVERKHNEQHKENIERLVSGVIHRKYLSRIKDREEKFLERQDMLARMQDSLLERSVMIKILLEYAYMYTKSGVPKSGESSNFSAQDTVDIPIIRDISKGRSILEDLVSGPAIFIDKNVFIGKGSRNCIDGVFLKFGVNEFRLQYLCTSQEFSERYDKALLRKIQLIIQDNCLEYVKRLQDLDARIRSFDKLLAENNFVATAQSGKLGDISYRRSSHDTYEVVLKIPPYIIEHEGNYYRFGSVKIFVNVVLAKNSVMMPGKPEVVPDCMPYLHPFVFPTAGICYGDQHCEENVTRWTIRGIDFNYHYSYDSPFAKKVATALNEAKQVIERGYIGDTESLVPVHKLNPESFHSEFIGRGLVRESSSGIHRDRIFHSSKQK